MNCRSARVRPRTSAPTKNKIGINEETIQPLVLLSKPWHICKCFQALSMSVAAVPKYFSA